MKTILKFLIAAVFMSQLAACAQRVGPDGVHQKFGPFEQKVGPNGVEQSAGPCGQSAKSDGVEQGCGH